jgi:hypothetical protein
MEKNKNSHRFEADITTQEERILPELVHNRTGVKTNREGRETSKCASVRSLLVEPRGRRRTRKKTTICDVNEATICDVRVSEKEPEKKNTHIHTFPTHAQTSRREEHGQSSNRHSDGGRYSLGCEKLSCGSDFRRWKCAGSPLWFSHLTASLRLLTPPPSA